VEKLAAPWCAVAWHEERSEHLVVGVVCLLRSIVVDSCIWIREETSSAIESEEFVFVAQKFSDSDDTTLVEGCGVACDYEVEGEETVEERFVEGFS